MANNLGNLALDGGDPRIDGVGEVEVPTVVRRNMHDPNVPFEEYLYYAKIQREQEKNGLGPEERERMYQEHLAGKEIGDEKIALPEIGNDGKTEPQPINESKSSSITKAHVSHVGAGEWETASRAARNATWGAVYVEFLNKAMAYLTVTQCISHHHRYFRTIEYVIFRFTIRICRRCNDVFLYGNYGILRWMANLAHVLKA